MQFLNELCFIWFTKCVLLSDDNSLIQGCLWLLAFVLDNSLILGIWCSTIPHLSGCFLSLDLLSEYRIQHSAIGPLNVTSSYSTWIFCRGFRLNIWLPLRRLVSWINHLPPSCWSTFWKSIFKQQLGCWCEIMDSISNFFCTFTYAIIYVLIRHIIFWLYLYFSSTPVLTSSIDLVFVLYIKCITRKCVWYILRAHGHFRQIIEKLKNINCSFFHMERCVAIYLSKRGSLSPHSISRHKSQSIYYLCDEHAMHPAGHINIQSSG